jgi:serine protease Do
MENLNQNNGHEPFYFPNEKKNKRVGLRYLLLGLGGGLVGGGLAVMVAFSFISPNSTFSNIVPGFLKLSAVNTLNQGSTLKKIEIEESTSPVVGIAQKVGPSIVGIRVQYDAPVSFDFFGDLAGGTEKVKGEGSGIIVKKDGYILTNYHVIENAYSASSKKQSGSIEVYLVNNNKKSIPAKVIGADEQTDLAIIKIDQDNLPEAELGNSSDVKVGELAVAIGNPLGLEFAGSVTAGVISAVNRTMNVDGRQFNLLQTDAAINEGNSGGALVNSKGQVIGVNTIKMASTGVEGLGFAIPIDEVKPIMDNLIKYNYVKGRPQVGIGGVNVDERTSQIYDIPEGIYVKQVSPFSGAERAGIQIGDVIVEFAGKPVKTIEELNDIKKDYKAGDTIKVVFIRDGARKTVDLKLTEIK